MIGIPCASFSAILFQSAKTIGESTIVGYIKAIPQELICTFGTGTGIGDLFNTLTTLAIVHYGIEAADYSLFFSFLLIPYFMCFTYFENARLSHKQHKNVFKIEVTRDTVHKVERLPSVPAGSGALKDKDNL